MRRLALLLCASLLAACRPSRDASVKNVVLVTLDTTRFDALGAYGNRAVKTPVLDRMAARGHLFRSCYSHAPVTLPSHASILTGKLPPVHGVRNNINYALPKETRRLPQILARHGFATGAFVSSFILDRRFGLGAGFDVYEDDIVHYSENRREKEIVTRRAGVTIDRMLSWLDEPRQAPFFAWLHLYDAHAPYEPPLPFRQAYAGDPYLGEIAYMDYELGRLVRYLEEKGLADETLIVVTADHGESNDEHGEKTHGFFCYGSTTHVPLVLSKPVYGKPGQSFEHVVQSIDLAPSILKLLGLPADEGMEGLPLDSTRERRVYSEAMIPHEDFYLAPVHSLKDGRYSFYYSSTMELYDLRTDPGEKRNLAPYQPRRLRKLRERMEAGLASWKGEADRVSLDQETIELLKSLGYVAGGGSFSREADPYKYPSPFRSIQTYRQMQALREFEERYPFKTIEGLRKLIEADRRQVVLYRDLGRLATFAGDEEEAISSLRKAALLRPSDARLHNFLGLGYYAFGRFPESLAEYQVALGLDPGQQIARYNMSLALVKLDRVDEAVRALEEIVAKEPSNLFALNNLAFLQLDRFKNPAKASEYISRAWAVNSRHPLIVANKALVEAALKAGPAGSTRVPSPRAGLGTERP